MQESIPGTRALRAFSTHRLGLLAGVGVLAFSVVAGGPAWRVGLGALSSPAEAQNLQRPVGFADIVEKVKPAVVSVRVKMDGGPRVMGFEGELPFPKGSPMERFFRQFGMPDQGNPGGGSGGGGRNMITGQGSGFFISADGYAVTNNHVVDKAENVQVTTDDGKIYQAKVIGTDPRSDLALIKVDGRGDFPFVKLAEGNPRIGDWVLAVGNPFGLGGTVTAGIVSARGRDIGSGPYDDFIQIDAPVNKGNSGGPTFDVDGNVIGVNTAIFSPSGGSVGIAFAIPADTVRKVVSQLKDKGSVTRGWIGVQIQSVTPEIADSLGLKNAAGALVAEPQSGGPAAKAGIEAGDVITGVNGSPIKDARELAREISSMPPNTSVKLSLLHKGAEKSVTLTLGVLPNEREARAEPTKDDSNGTDVPRLGLTLAPAGKVAGSGNEGVVVTNVDPNGIAADHGFKTGDVILDVGGKKVANPGEVRDAIRDAQKDGKQTVLMRVKSGNEGTKFVALRLGKA
ncbi:MAG TPA: Do family serine endopeptidase [Xanthobacteraceae bacterium]|nr:Do family serine endopeptidase [Xanthobacteraceae bacterium]